MEASSVFLQVRTHVVAFWRLPPAVSISVRQRLVATTSSGDNGKHEFGSSVGGLNIAKGH